MIRLAAHVFASLAIATALVACSGGTRAEVVPPTMLTAQQHADRACRAAVPRGFVNAKPTTVGEIHGITDGPDSHPYWFVLASLPDHDSAAWCWHRLKPHDFELLVVGPRGEVVTTGQGLQGGGPPGPGPLTFM